MTLKLVLLDRDGVLNQDIEGGYVLSPGELVMLPGVAEAVARLNARGLIVAICTNQSCIGKGLIDAAMLERIHNTLRDHLAGKGAHIDAIFFAPDPPWAATDRRKPGPGMLREAMAQFRAAPGETVFIGDNVIDLQAGKTAGVRCMLVRTGKGKAMLAKGLPAEVLPVTVVENLTEAVDRLLAETAQSSNTKPTNI